VRALALAAALVLAACDGSDPPAPTCPEVVYTDVSPTGYCGMIPTGPGTATPCSTACTTVDEGEPASSPDGCHTTAKLHTPATAGDMVGPVVCFPTLEACAAVCTETQP